MTPRVVCPTCKAHFVGVTGRGTYERHKATATPWSYRMVQCKGSGRPVSAQALAEWADEKRARLRAVAADAPAALAKAEAEVVRLRGVPAACDAALAEVDAFVAAHAKRIAKAAAKAGAP